MTQRIHGGPDAFGVPRFDFSTNSNACGPCPIALTAVLQADATRYPDASYAALRQQLAAFHGVDVWRVVLAGSASEFIFRITALVAQQGNPDLPSLGKPRVYLPPHCYGDYAQAAQAWGLPVTTTPDDAQLVWACEPSSPLGGAHAAWPEWLAKLRTAQVNTRRNNNGLIHSDLDHSDQANGLSVRAEPSHTQPALVLDRAYEPLRLSGAATLTAAQLAQVWQLWTPNKALGLTGVRAAYAIAPLGSAETVAALARLSASWPVGAHGVAMLQAWVQPEVQAWLANSLLTLKTWKVRQITLLAGLGWHCLPSETPFFCAKPAPGVDLTQLRAAGIKLRDTTSFGLPGLVRMSVQAPDAQDALALVLQDQRPIKALLQALLSATINA